MFGYTSKKKFLKLKKWYGDQLRLKDEEIKRLKFENRTLMNTAFKQSQRLEELKDMKNAQTKSTK